MDVWLFFAFTVFVFFCFFFLLCSWPPPQPTRPRLTHVGTAIQEKTNVPVAQKGQVTLIDQVVHNVERGPPPSVCVVLRLGARRLKTGTSGPTDAALFAHRPKARRNPLGSGFWLTFGQRSVLGGFLCFS